MPAAPTAHALFTARTHTPERHAVAGRTGSAMVTQRPGKMPIPTLRPGYDMEALEIERQTDQTPLARRRRDPTQGELAEAEYLFDDADHRFDGAFACPVDRFAQRGPKLVRHLDLCARVLRRRVRQRREALLRARDDGDHDPWRCRARC